MEKANLETVEIASSLRAELAARLAQFRREAPAEAVSLIDATTRELAESQLLKNALGVDDEAPDFALPDHRGERFSLGLALKRGPVILSFYRGGWCPYCNLELRAYQRVLGEIEAAGGQLVAISPEKPDRAAITAAQNEVSFPVLTDAKLAVARRFGIVFDLAQPLHALYTKFGHALPDVNGDDSWCLPAPATFVIGRDRRIAVASVDADYRQRLEPAEAIAALRRLA